jgi:hypothetical protein
MVIRCEIAIVPQPESPISGGDRATGEGFAAEQCRVWLDWAAAQLDASLARDATACDHLLAALNDLMGSTPADESIGRKMSAVIVAVQGHDRVTQGLTHVAQSLRALHRHLGDARCAESGESWRMLREQQMRTFSMAEERVLFARMVADELLENAAENPDDTVVLFGAEYGSVDT